jgi:hypothetical protein
MRTIEFQQLRSACEGGSTFFVQPADKPELRTELGLMRRSVVERSGRSEQKRRPQGPAPGSTGSICRGVPAITEAASSLPAMPPARSMHVESDLVDAMIGDQPRTLGELGTRPGPHGWRSHREMRDARLHRGAS